MFELPVFPESAKFDYPVTLTGREYLLRFRWFARSATWELDVMLPDETPLAMGRRLTTAWNVLHRDKDARLPAGYIVPIGVDGELRDIETKADLGSVVKILYYEPGEIA